MAMRVALHPFLAGMNRSQLALLTDCAMVVHFNPGEVIFREGELANRFYLIETGKDPRIGRESWRSGHHR